MALPNFLGPRQVSPFPALELNLSICKMGAGIVPTLLGDYLYLLYLFNKHDVPGT